MSTVYNSIHSIQCRTKNLEVGIDVTLRVEYQTVPSSIPFPTLPLISAQKRLDRYRSPDSLLHALRWP